MSFSIRIPLKITATGNTAPKSARGLLALAIALSLANPSFAQNQNAGQGKRDEKKTWYKVEIILFRQGGNPLESLEQWDPNPKMSYPLNWASLVSPESLASESTQGVDTSTGTSLDATINSPELPPRSILMLPKESFALKSEAQKLQRSSKYRILFHAAWQQGFTEGTEPPAIIINAGDMFDSHAELEGTIQLKLQRYLHITTDLWLTQFTTNFGQERSRWPELPWPPNKTRADIPSMSDEKNLGGSAWNQAPATTRYDSLLSKPYIVENIAKINETRRMRSKELHYIDHPLLGILIQFTPSEAPAPL